MFVSHNEWENYLLRLDRAPFLLCVKLKHVQDGLSTNCIQGEVYSRKSLEHAGTKECLNNWISETILFVFKAEYFNLMHSEISLFWGFGYLHSTISSLTLRCLAIIRCHPATVTTIIVSMWVCSLVYHTSTNTAKCLVSSNVNQDNLKFTAF